MSSRNAPDSGSTARVAAPSGKIPGTVIDHTCPARAAAPASTPPRPTVVVSSPVASGRARAGASAPVAAPAAAPARRRPARPRLGSSARQPAQRSDEDVRGRWAARHLDVDRNHVTDRALHAVTAGEHPAVACAVAHRDDALGPRGRLVRRAQRVGHVARHRPGHEQRIRVPGGGDQPQAVPFRVVHRPERRSDLQLASVARTGVNVTQLHRTRQRRGRRGVTTSTGPHTGRRWRRLGDPTGSDNLAKHAHRQSSGLKGATGRETPSPGAAGYSRRGLTGPSYSPGAVAVLSPPPARPGCAAPPQAARPPRGWSASSTPSMPHAAPTPTPNAEHAELPGQVQRLDPEPPPEWSAPRSA